MKKLLCGALLLASCAKAELNFVFSTSDQPASVDVSGQTHSATPGFVQMAFSSLTFSGEQETVFTSEPVILVELSPGQGVSLEGALFEGAYDQLSMTFQDIGVNSLTGEEVIGAVNITGTIDLDQDPLEEETSFEILLPNDETTLTFPVSFTAVKGQTSLANVALDLETLFAGVDFGQLTLDPSGVLSIHAAANTAALPILQQNLQSALIVSAL